MFPVIANIYIQAVYPQHPVARFLSLYQFHKSSLLTSHKTRVIIIALLLIPHTARAHSASDGSVIVLIRTADEIVIAADSLESNSDGTTEYVCKIRQVHDAFFAFSGIAAIKEIGYDVWNVAETALATKGSLSSRVRAFEKLINPRLKRVLEVIRRDDKQHGLARYDKYRNSLASLEILFCGVENGTLVYYYRGFKAVGDRQIVIMPIREGCAANCDSETHVPLLGHADAITKLQNSGGIIPQPALWMVARDLVKAEIDSGDPKVGGSIDVLRITKTGVEWKQRKPECREIQPYTAREEVKTKRTKKFRR